MIKTSLAPPDPRARIEQPAAPHQASALLAILPLAVLRLEPDERVSYANPAAEELFGTSAAQLAGGLSRALASDSSLLALIRRARSLGSPVREHAVRIALPKRGIEVDVDIDVTPLGPEAGSGTLLVCLRERAVAHRLDQQLHQRESARAVAALAAMLAHEVKNPLSGIRGAAQLLEEDASEADRELARMIRDEVDRIAALITRMEAFGDLPPLRRGPTNIHEVLDHVRALASSGFARHVRFVEAYDPSLPPVLGGRDELIQLFLNLVKNAAEALPERGGEIVLGTSYAPGLVVEALDGTRRHPAPICVSVRDDGGGIPDSVRDNVFDPYVTTKAAGSGLGLAMVAKIVRDHGGAIEFDSRPRRTEFRIYLPAEAASGKVVSRA